MICYYWNLLCTCTAIAKKRIDQRVIDCKNSCVEILSILLGLHVSIYLSEETTKIQKINKQKCLAQNIKECYESYHLKEFLIPGRRDIEEVQVRCANTERGCQWTGTVGTLEDHAASCQFALVPCPNKCEEDEGTGELLLIRKHLDQHLKTKCPKRAYKCQHCGEKGTFASITEDHDKVCEKKIVACPNKETGCSLSLDPGKVEEHVSKDCGYTEVACVYEILGCGVKMLRKDREIHENKDRGKHFDLSMVILKMFSEQVEILTEHHEKELKQHKENHKRLMETVRLQDEQLKTLKTLTEKNKMLSAGEAVVLKLQGFANKKEKNEEFLSLPFFTHPGGYRMCVLVYANGNGDGKGTHVSVFIKLLESRYDNQLNWPFLGTVKYELLNQLGDDNHHKVVSRHLVQDNMKVGNTRGYVKFLPHSSVGHNQTTNTQYLLNDTLYFRVSVKVDDHKPWLDCMDKVSVDSIKTINNDETLKNNEFMIFKTTNFKEWKATKLAFVTSFYTSSCGYHMQISVVANGYGDGKGTHVSVYIKLLQGRNDNQLYWPFLGTVTYELLNQLTDDNHHKMVDTLTILHGMKVGSFSGYGKFFSHSSLGHNPATNIQYLLNDALYFRVSVKVDDHKPWLVCTH